MAHFKKKKNEKKKMKKKNEKKNINRFEQKDLQEYEKARLGISRPLL